MRAVVRTAARPGDASLHPHLGPVESYYGDTNADHPWELRANNSVALAINPERQISTKSDGH